MTESSAFSGIDLTASIKRLDSLLEENPPVGKMELGFGLGTRLALGMALELKGGKAIGSETSAMIANWVLKYGEEQVEICIEIARNFLTNPSKLKEGLEKRLFSK